MAEPTGPVVGAGGPNATISPDSLCREAADGFLVHVYRAQRWDQVLSYLDVVEADYRHIPRDIQPGLV